MAFLISGIHNLCVYAKELSCEGKPVDFIADFLSRMTAAKASVVGHGAGKGIATPVRRSCLLAASTLLIETENSVKTTTFLCRPPSSSAAFGDYRHSAGWDSTEIWVASG